MAISLRFFNSTGLSKSAWYCPPLLVSLKVPDLIKIGINNWPESFNTSKIPYSIVRVVDRRNTANRDFVINLKPSNSLIYEVKKIGLAKPSKYDEFFLFLQKLQNSTFGVLSGFSRSWLESDRRAVIYEEVHEIETSIIELPEQQELANGAITC